MDYDPDTRADDQANEGRETAVTDDTIRPTIVAELEAIVADWTDRTGAMRYHDGYRSWSDPETTAELRRLGYTEDEAEEAVRGHEDLQEMDLTAMAAGSVLSMAHNRSADRTIVYEGDLDLGLSKPPFNIGKELPAEKILILDAPTTAPGHGADGLVVNTDRIHGSIGGQDMVNRGMVEDIDTDYHDHAGGTILNYGEIDRHGGTACTPDEYDGGRFGAVPAVLDELDQEYDTVPTDTLAGRLDTAWRQQY